MISFTLKIDTHADLHAFVHSSTIPKHYYFHFYQV